MLAPIRLSSPGPVFSRLVAGVMTWGVWGHDLDIKEMSAMIDHCLSLGITTFDHADIYGHYTTEEAFGNALALQPRRRHEMQLVTKCGIRLVCKERPENVVKAYDHRKEYIIASAERSLRNLRTDYLDLLLIHRPSPLMQADEVAEAIAHLKAAGKVQHFGVSNFTPSQLDYLRQVTPLVTNQVEASLLHTAPFFDGTFDQCLQLGMHPMAWSPLGGFFNRDDETASRVADQLDEIGHKYRNPGADVILLAWLLHHPAEILPVLGTARPSRMTAAAQALEISLTDLDWFELLEAARGHEVA
ncbi:aldo/keto reductase family oxidoreductase [Lewinella sp. LCG006]|uniref:aldo/keto reductase n=1 Tax=Lewinella sp. LCG006 TaxID=3231911 RepID=UPI0034609458